jgi:hypothetical protein
MRLEKGGDEQGVPAGPHTDGFQALAQGGRKIGRTRNDAERLHQQMERAAQIGILAGGGGRGE